MESEDKTQNSADAMELPGDDCPAEARVRHRGIYLLPNLLTTGAMFAGFYAILAGMNGNFHHAALAIFVAMFFDGLDGQVARMTNTQSAFGVQYDSLSDMVSFGVAPAVVAFSWMLHSIGKLGWAAAFIYASCAALRLARFNTQVDVVDKRYFIGLASPSAAALVAGMVWSGYGEQPSTALALLAALVTAIAGLLMVSNLRYKSLKGMDLKGRVPFVVILAVALVVAIILIDPARMLLGLAVIYALSGPALWFHQQHKARSRNTPGDASPVNDSPVENSPAGTDTNDNSAADPADDGR
ncbi:MAG: CDP-diacylglycerol--serine O-phosphatidyltransferase [Bacteroidales bacterium]|nr:CDP-diacylglycerol--serine O-phosphatidyltransferase [Bacteroidales bacterium]